MQKTVTKKQMYRQVFEIDDGEKHVIAGNDIFEVLRTYIRDILNEDEDSWNAWVCEKPSSEKSGVRITYLDYSHNLDIVYYENDAPEGVENLSIVCRGEFSATYRASVSQWLDILPNAGILSTTCF